MTAEEILEGGFARSSKNQPHLIASAPGEYLPIVARALGGLFQVAARVNRTAFAASQSVAYSSGGWPRPPAAESVFRITSAARGRVALVPFDDPECEPSRPSVYELGQVFYSSGREIDPPSSDTLTFQFSKRPAPINALSAPVDQALPADFRGLLESEVAIYLAIKDNRLEEIEAMKQERQADVLRFIAWLEHATVGMVRRKGFRTQTHTYTIESLSKLLAGGGT